MAEPFHLFLLLLFSSFTISSFPSQPNLPSHPQINNIIEALIGAGDFSNWATVLSVTDPSTFPVTATLFIPNDAAASDRSSLFDPSIIAYHIVPQQLSFSEIQLFGVGSRLPTLLPGKSILITNNTRLNYTIDDSRITHPDIYINGAVAVHGIGSILNYSVYGDRHLEDNPVANSPSLPSSADPPLLNVPGSQTGGLGQVGQVGQMGQSHSDAPCLCTEFPIIFLVGLIVIGLKIHGYYPIR